MEDFLATVRSISADKNYVQLAEFLNRSNELLTKYAGQIDAAIASLDPDQHALAFMALLLVKLSLPNYGDFELIFSQIQQFITVCSKDQIQFGAEKFANICHFITQCLVDLKQVCFHAIMFYIFVIFTLTVHQYCSFFTAICSNCLNL
ncbi:PREDICTED: COP9 signalosome complex subunit 3-like [Acropora digitifera]|uniref:COP9 signalosome complex subunit 3-like n=1 Tax=Acropora digitifera TaxID=70779 RepID=UPI00077A5A6C|nr:PREDICTED: COP9 signalosome complex subunit 3-like [Acropora digitifera]